MAVMVPKDTDQKRVLVYNCHSAVVEVDLISVSNTVVICAVVTAALVFVAGFAV